MNQENQDIYDDYTLFASLVENENSEIILSKPRVHNTPLLKSTISSYSENGEELSSCALEKSLLDYGYDGYGTWEECSIGSRAGFIVASYAVLLCFFPGNVFGCSVAVVSLAATTANMINTGKQCTATYERAEANYNRCYSSNEENGADDPGRDTGGDGYNSGGLRCARWQRVVNYWQQGFGGADSGGWESRDVCVSWVRD